MSFLGLDPVIVFTLRVGIMLLFATAAFHKLTDVPAFRRTLEDYRLLPRVLTGPAVWLLILLEASLALALVVPAWAPIAAVSSAALLLIYGLAISLNLVRGRRQVDCGCTGPAFRQPISEGLVARNLVIAGLAILAAQPVAHRDLGSGDFALIAAAVCACVALYLAVNTLLANGPLLKSLNPDYE